MRQDYALALWHRAAGSPLGIRIKTPNPKAIRTDLYHARKAQPDGLEHLVIRSSPVDPQGEVWLVKKPTVSTNSNARAVD